LSAGDRWAQRGEENSNPIKNSRCLQNGSAGRYSFLAFLPVVAARTCPAKSAEQTVAVLVFGSSVFLSVGVSTFLAWFVYQEGVVNVTTLLV